MKNITPFQIGVYVACVIGIIGAVLLFSGKIPIGNNSGTQTISGSVTMWGTIPFEDMDAILETVRNTYRDVIVTYIPKDPKTFQNELVNALASGVGPDMVMVKLSDIIQNKDRLLTIPFTSLSEPLFRTTFLDQGELYMNDQGVVAFPFSVDPMVMYFNRDMLTSSFVVQPPSTWDDIIALNKKITQSNDSGSLSSQTVALGTYDNITRAKELITMLIFQSGNRLIQFDNEQKKYVSTFSESSNDTVSAGAAMGFYTSFADNTDTEHYSWNRTFPNDRDQFLAGKLAIYFGYASEVPNIRSRNPNLNFGVAMMPQRTASPVKITYGDMTGIAIMKISKNPMVAVTVAQTIVGKSAVDIYLGINQYIAPARRDMLIDLPTDAIRSMIYKSAIISRGFLDPDPVQTTGFFRRYIDQINSGLVKAESIVTPGGSLFTSILNNVQK